jgi:hypothetical protein
MSKSISENLRKANNIHYRLSVNGIREGCMTIVHRAFGVAPSAGGKQSSEIGSPVENRKLETSLFTRSQTPILPDALYAMINMPKLAAEKVEQKNPAFIRKPFNERRHLGVVVSLIAKEGSGEQSHGLAIFPPRRFGRRLSNQLLNHDAQVVVDAADGRTVFSATTDELANRINRHIQNGGAVEYIFVQKKVKGKR